VSPSDPTGSDRPAGRDLPSLLLSALLLAMGVTVLVDAAGLEAPPGSGVIGPAAFMWAVGGALVVLSVVLALVALNGRPDEALAHNPLIPAPDEHGEEELGHGAGAAGPAEPDLGVAGGPRPLLRARPAVRVAVLVAGLLVHAAIISSAGYIVAAAVLFLTAALAFGAPRLLPPLLIGAVLATVIFYSFVLGLGLGLPYLGGG
jgi:putative tricarboxylic transport membrane protein